MVSYRLTVALLAGLAALTSGTLLTNSDSDAQDRVTPIPNSIPQRRSQEGVESLMHAKLSHSHQILDGLVNHDFDSVELAAGDLKKMSLDPPDGWKRNDADGEVYEHFRMEFMRQAAQLERAAREKNLSGAAWYQQNLTATCIECHNYIRDYDR
ncbi:MAG: hypothetical protein KDA91_06210 [Planctomycetaceae bacterium]|nr:hypothetical protein [Planctomycetaceae bacterium]